MLVEELFNQDRIITGSLFEGKPYEARGNWIGEEGVRQDFILTLSARIPLNEGYSVAIYKFLDDDGNDITWFASRDIDFVIGQKYSIRATVKKHGVYRDTKQTTIYRVKNKGMLYDIPADEPMPWELI